MKILIAGYESQTKNYIAAIEGLGAHALVALTLDADEIAEYDGLILPGGGDINPIFFHQGNYGSKNIDTALDVLQFQMLQQFIAAGKSVVGICKGMQLINVHFGGTIMQHCFYAAFHEYITQDQIHSVTAVPHSFLAKLYGETFTVNSAHHQCIGRLAPSLSAASYSCDNIIEAVVHDSLPVYGLQWHPERMCMAHKRDDTVDGSKVLAYCFNF